EPRRRPSPLEPERAAAPALLPRAREGGRAAPAGLGARRRDRDRPGRQTGVRRAAAPPAPGGEPHPEAVGRDPRGVRRLRPDGVERRARARAAAGEAAARAGAQGEAVPALSRLARAEAGGALARPARGRWARRRGREAARTPIPPRVARRSRQGEALQDRGLRDRRLPLERQGGGTDLHAPARALRRRRRARLRWAMLRVPGDCPVRE